MDRVQSTQLTIKQIILELKLLWNILYALFPDVYRSQDRALFRTKLESRILNFLQLISTWLISSTSEVGIYQRIFPSDNQFLQPIVSLPVG